MRKSTWLQLIDGLAHIPVPEDAKRQFEELIRSTAKLDGVSVVDRLARVKYARHLLDQHEKRAVICHRLMLRFEIGRTPSYQIISEALQLSGFS